MLLDSDEGANHVLNNISRNRVRDCPSVPTEEVQRALGSRGRATSPDK